MLGNSVYGKMITRKDLHRDVKYYDDPIKVSKKVSSPKFVAVDEISEDFFEVTTEKSRILLDTPVVNGFAVLQYAKLRMLQFYYDCIDRYILFEFI